MISVAELLAEGQARSGGNGVPFVYANPYESNGLPEVTYYLHDHLGNTRVTYTAGCKSEPGGSPIRELTLVHAADYHPYGIILREWRAGPAEKYLTTHHERDTETGLDYRSARYYDAEVARFLSLDPNGGDYASWSAYNYVFGKPTSVIDPDGRDGWDIIKGAFAAWADNQAPANPNPYVKNIRERMSYSNASHYNLGQNIGDIASSVIGAVEALSGLRNVYAGGSMAATGIAATPVSGGSSITVSLAGGGLVVAGIAQVTHGGMVVLNAVENMGNGKGRVPESKPSDSAPTRQSGERMKSTDSANEQLEGIEKAQAKSRQSRPKTQGADANPEWEGAKSRPKATRISSTAKSQQRAANQRYEED